MELFDLNNLRYLTDYLSSHPHIGGLIAFGIAFLESLAVIGGLFPGSVIMTAVGALIGSGTMPFASTLVWVISGAFLGDFLSYGIGAYYNERLRSMWPFRKYPKLLATGEDFLKKHGGKSIVIGRFFGPIRSVVPLVAGLLHLSTIRFVLADIVASILWCVVYVFPGIAVGALSLDLPPATATKFILIVLAVVAFGWILLVALHFCFQRFKNILDGLIHRLSYWLYGHTSTRWFTSLLAPSSAGLRGYKQNASIPSNLHSQIRLAILCFLYLLLFVFVAENAITQTHLFHLNTPVFEFLRSIRTRVGDQVMLAATMLGDKHTLLSAGILVFIWLLCKRYVRAALHWGAVILFSAGVADAFKLLYFSPRPSGLLFPQLTSSFPSGHAVLSTALFGFLAILIQTSSKAVMANPVSRATTQKALQELDPSFRRDDNLDAGNDGKKICLWLAGFFIGAVCLSRIYLGAHWILDVIGSLLLGLACVSLVTLSYRRYPSKPLSPATYIVAIMIFLVTWAAYGISHFRQEQKNYTLYWPAVTVDTKILAQQPDSTIPLFTVSRLGKPDVVLNIEWLDTPIETIQSMLLQQGWKSHIITPEWKVRLHRFSSAANPEQVPVWPILYQNQPPVLMMTRSIPGKLPLHFMLWKSNTVSPNNTLLWIGSLHYKIPQKDKKALDKNKIEIEALYEEAIELFKVDLQGISSHVYRIPEEKQPNAVRDLNWNGELLVVGRVLPGR